MAAPKQRKWTTLTNDQWNHLPVRPHQEHRRQGAPLPEPEHDCQSGALTQTRARHRGVPLYDDPIMSRPRCCPHL
jgi:hypothetical protein